METALAYSYWAALAGYGSSAALALLRPRLGRHPLSAALAIHLAATVALGCLIGFFPLTNKFESFSAAALALALVARATWRSRRVYDVFLLALVLAAMATALGFPHRISFAPPLMYTLWYPLHVPLSFAAYALWAAAAAAGVAWAFERSDDWLAAVDRFSLMGFGLWSLSMICGGVWGVLAWGVYFMWDPKMIWSVLLWFHYAAFAHARLTPSLATRVWLRPLLAVLGLVWVFVAYVGTSFFFGRSSHAF